MKIRYNIFVLLIKQHTQNLSWLQKQLLVGTYPHKNILTDVKVFYF